MANDGTEPSDTRTETRETVRETDRAEEPAEPAQTEPADRVADTALRMGLAIVGFVLLLFALGQAVGFDMLYLVADALSSQTGRWLLVALFALLLIALAARWRTSTRY